MRIAYRPSETHTSHYVASQGAPPRHDAQNGRGDFVHVRRGFSHDTQTARLSRLAGDPCGGSRSNQLYPADIGNKVESPVERNDASHPEPLHNSDVDAVYHSERPDILWQSGVEAESPVEGQLYVTLRGPDNLTVVHNASVRRCSFLDASSSGDSLCHSPCHRKTGEKVSEPSDQTDLASPLLDDPGLVVIRILWIPQRDEIATVPEDHGPPIGSGALPFICDSELGVG